MNNNSQTQVTAALVKACEDMLACLQHTKIGTGDAFWLPCNADVMSEMREAVNAAKFSNRTVAKESIEQLKARTIRRFIRELPHGAEEAITHQCSTGRWAAWDSVGGSHGNNFPTEEAARASLEPACWNHPDCCWTETP